MSIKRYTMLDGPSEMDLDATGNWVEYADHQDAINTIVDNFDLIELWYVKGIAGQYFVDKLEAERVCRGTFGDESPEQRYARIFFRRFYREVAMNPEVAALGRYCFAEGVKHATSERDRYRELLEARVSGLEAMLNAFVAQTRGSVTIHKQLWDKANDYLAGNGPT